MALVMEFVFNDIIVLLRHIILPLLGFLFYVGTAASFSALLGEPVYGLHLTFLPFNNKLNWAEAMEKYKDEEKIVSRI